jgi:hypothetical protein
MKHDVPDSYFSKNLFYTVILLLLKNYLNIVCNSDTYLWSLDMFNRIPTSLVYLVIDPSL